VKTLDLGTNAPAKPPPRGSTPSPSALSACRSARGPPPVSTGRARSPSRSWCSSSRPGRLRHGGRTAHASERIDCSPNSNRLRSRTEDLAVETASLGRNGAGPAGERDGGGEKAMGRSEWPRRGRRSGQTPRSVLPCGARSRCEPRRRWRRNGGPREATGAHRLRP
jgi:hypothetical protein